MRIVDEFASKDGKTKKFLQETEDGNIIETGYYDLDEHIVCISSQIGCPIGCVFCATAGAIASLKRPFVRNLSVEEIVGQVSNILSNLDRNTTSKRILFSYMGMGEPFLNFENIVDSIKRLASLFPNSRATIGTTGVDTKKIMSLADEDFPILLKLHLSVHAPNDSLRVKLIPGAKSLKASLDALLYFSLKKAVSCKVNYLLIQGLNDSEKDARELGRLLSPYPFTVKLSRLNTFGSFCPSEEEKFSLFEKILGSFGLTTCRFVSTGVDIGAGCGQFRRHFAKEACL
jgi:23S rRNA (adenine2503-C2)-methyltransferase